MKNLQKQKNQRKIEKLRKIKLLKKMLDKKKRRFIKLFSLKKRYNLLKIKIKNKLKKKKQSILSFYLNLTNPKLIKVENNVLTTNWGSTNELNNTQLQNVIQNNEKLMYFYDKSFLKTNSILFSFNKELTLVKWNSIRQFIMFVNELIYSLQENTKFLFNQTAQLSYVLKSKHNIEQVYYSNYVKQTINQFFLKKNNTFIYRNKNIYFNSITFKALQNILILNYFNILLNNLNNTSDIKINIKKNILNLSDGFIGKHLNIWDKKGNSKIIFYIDKNILLQEELEKKREKINSIYRRKNSHLIKPNILISINTLKNLKKEKVASYLKNYIWKRKSYFQNINNYFELNKLLHIRNKKLRISRRKTTSQLFYILSRIEVKIKDTNDLEIKNNLLQLQTLLQAKLLKKQKQVNSNNMIISNRENIKKIRKESIINKLDQIWNNEKYLNNKLFNNNTKYQNFIKKIKNKLDKIEKEKLIENNSKTKPIKKFKIKNIKMKTFFKYNNLTQRRKMRNLINVFKITQWRNKLKNKRIRKQTTRKIFIAKLKDKYFTKLKKESILAIKESVKQLLTYEKYTYWQMDLLKEKLKMDGLKETIKNTIAWRRRVINTRKMRRKIREKTYILRLKFFKNRRNKRFLKIKKFKSKIINTNKQRKKNYLQQAKKKKNQPKKTTKLVNPYLIKTFKKAKGNLKKDFLRKLFKKIKIRLILKKKRLFKFNLKKNASLKYKIWNKSWRKKKLRVRRTWINVHPVIKGKYTTYNQKKLLLTAWAGFPLNLFMINTLAFTKLSFRLDRLKTKHNNPTKIISKMDRDYINRYKYVAIYIKDLVRIGIISMFFKKPSFLAKFTAFQLAKLPKNRKETVFIRFLMKAIRTFSAGRKEIVALRMKFKGRVNRWRRTKFIMRTRGTFPFRTITERIEHGSAQAINRKGAVGIHIWIRYKPSFLLKIQDHILSYMRYSKGLKNIKRKKIKNIKI